MVKVFLSYSHRDESLREQLAAHLTALQQEELIELWHDRHILPGQPWAGCILKALRSADIILLLVSSDFISSRYCRDIEIPEALHRQGRGEAVVMPVILRPCEWQGLRFGALQALPKNAKPVTDYDRHDNAFLEIVQGIKKIAKQLLENSRGTSTQSIAAPLPGVANDFQPLTQDDLAMLSLLTRWQGRLSVQELKAVCRRALPPGCDLDWLCEDDFLDCCAGLLDCQPPHSNGRSLLYEVLAALQAWAGAEEQKNLQAALKRLETRFQRSGLTTAALPPLAQNQPAVVEIVFEPRLSEDQQGYAVRSRWRGPDGAVALPGPSREDTERGWLPLGAATPQAAVSAQAREFSLQIIDSLDCWDPDAVSQIAFVFRLPDELMFYPVENWPKDSDTALGEDYPVLVAARERRTLRPCSEYWNQLKPKMGAALAALLWPIECGDWPETEDGQQGMKQRIKQCGCPVLLKVPGLNLLQKLFEKGVAVALWPRTAEAEAGLDAALAQRLKAQALENLPFALRELRSDPGDHRNSIRHLTLLWDDPAFHQTPEEKAKRFHPGILN